MTIKYSQPPIGRSLQEPRVDPSLITLAREYRGFSQKALAAKLNVTQAAVSKIESGQLVPDSEMLARIGGALDFRPRFFLGKYGVYSPGMAFYRKHKTLPIKSARRIEAAINVIRIIVSELLKATEIDFKRLPLCPLEEFGTPASVARAIRQSLMIPRGPVPNMVHLVESLGVIIVPFDPETRLFSGVNMQVDSHTYVILVNSTMPGDRLRWTLAHELGHIIMHQVPSDLMEAEADAFAGELLMPQSDFLPEARSLNIERLAALKRRWKVSMSAIVTHLHKIGALSDERQKQIRIQLARFGITRLREPEELSVPVEAPRIFPELIRFHIDELGYKVGDLGDLLGVAPVEFLPSLSIDSETSSKSSHKLRLLS